MVRIILIWWSISFPRKLCEVLSAASFQLRDEPVVVIDAHGGNVKAVVFDVYVLHGAFQREHGLGVEFAVARNGAYLHVGDLPLQKRTVFDEHAMLPQLHVAKQRRDNEIDRKCVHGQHYKERDGLEAG